MKADAPRGWPEEPEEERPVSMSEINSIMVHLKELEERLVAKIEAVATADLAALERRIAALEARVTAPKERSAGR